RSCLEGEASDCNLLGVALEVGELGAPDPTAAAFFYRHGCEGGFAQSCNNLGWLYLLGRGVESDGRIALVLFERAFEQNRIQCDVGNIAGCRAAIALQDSMVLHDEDDKRLAAVLHRGCELGDAPSCKRGKELAR